MPCCKPSSKRALVLAMTIAAAVGTWGLHAYPVRLADDVFLQMIFVRKPVVFDVLSYGYAVLWFSTPFFAASMLMSLLAIVVSRHAPTRRDPAALPPYPAPEQRPTPVARPRRDRTSRPTPGRAPAPTWLTIPQRGLYTGVMILGAVGTGKTSACMYPYVEQLLRWRADDPERKIGGLVLEVKGDFCKQVAAMLRAGRPRRRLRRDRPRRRRLLQPAAQRSRPYAVAYAIATLLNNLFGKSKEPFWQQAYTDLLKFVILLRRISDGYTTFVRGVPLHPRRRRRSTATSDA